MYLCNIAVMIEFLNCLVLNALLPKARRSLKIYFWRWEQKKHTHTIGEMNKKNPEKYWRRLESTLETQYKASSDKEIFYINEEKPCEVTIRCLWQGPLNHLRSHLLYCLGGLPLKANSNRVSTFFCCCARPQYLFCV